MPTSYKKTYTKRKPKVNKDKLATKKYVKRLIHTNLENKHLNTHDIINITSVGSITDISAVARGDSDSQRSANRVKPMKLNINYSVTAGDEYNNVRVILFRWNQEYNGASGTEPTIASILNPNTSTVAYSSLLKFQDPINYSIIYDRWHFVAGDGFVSGSAVPAPYTASTQQHHRLSFYGNKINRSIEYTDSETSGKLGKYKMYMLLISDSPSLTLVHPTIIYDILLTYEDA